MSKYSSRLVSHWISPFEWVVMRQNPSRNTLKRRVAGQFRLTAALGQGLGDNTPIT